MQVFHRTANADAIVRAGFEDHTGTYLAGSLHSGVWLSDVPLDENQGASGDTVLTLHIPDEVFARYEWIEAGKPYREALVPADIVNRYGPPGVFTAD